MLRTLARCAALLLALVLSPAPAEPGNGPVGAPTLRWSGDGASAAQLELEVAFAVSGLVAEANVRQRFRNEGSRALDGEYLLPLPPGAAVHRLRMRIGTRVIEGEIREREAARAEFAAAAAAGQRSSLVEQHLADVFRTAVANVGPGETVEVEVGYWQRIAWRDGGFELVFPLSFVPRYDLAAGGAASVAAGPDPAMALPALANAALLAPPRVDIALAIEPGVPLRSLESASHAISVDRTGSGFRVALAGDTVPADRDFVLRWRPEPGAEPDAALMIEHGKEADYALVMLLPPAIAAIQLPRELVLVLDTSGSMLGQSLAGAKRAAARALERLTPVDTLAVIQFNSVTEVLFERPVAATPEAVRIAREWIEALEAEGGTEMLPAMEAALAGADGGQRVRQVVFITDGAVEHPDALYNLIEQRLGRSRLFLVGIGDAPNAGLLEQAARLGRGSAVAIRDLAEVDAGIGALFERLDRPAMKELTVRWPGLVESYPTELPDLYAGEPLLAVAKLPRASGEVYVLGQRQGAVWSKSLPLERRRSDAGIARLWAQARIAALEDERRRGADPAVVRAKVVDVALQHRLVTRYTSLVAVDRTPRPARDPGTLDATFANGLGADELAFAATATAAPRWLLAGLLGLALMLAALARAPRAASTRGAAR